jgi:REP element-mobilizing transposase RayT
MPFWQLYYHIVWSTKNRQPLLTPDVEPAIYGLLRKKAVDLGASIYALNGYLDHVHSFDRKRLSNFVAYVERQKEHHANSHIIPALEKDAPDGFHALKDDPAIYGSMDETWVQEMLSYAH